MKAGLAMPDLASELERQARSAEDFIQDTRRMGFFVGPIGDNGEVDHTPVKRDRKGNPLATHPVTLTMDDVDNDYRVNDFAENQIAARLRVPQKFWDRMRDLHPDILQDTVQRLFEREHARRLVRTLDGKARAFLSDRYRRLDNYDLMTRAVLPALAESATVMEVASANLTDLKLYVKVLFPEIEAPIKKVGDVVRCGIVISNSEVGAGRVLVEPLVYTLRCTNGLILPADFADFGLQKHHVGRRIDDDEAARDLFSDETLALDDKAFYAMVHDLVKSAATGVQFARIVARMGELNDLETTGDPVGVVERLGRSANLLDDEQSALMQHLIRGGDLSAYGYVNAVTRMAQDVTSYDRSTDLERVGGEMVQWSNKAWEELLSAPAPQKKETAAARRQREREQREAA